MKKILIIGSFPPPVGGISIHLKRLSKLLQDDYSILKIDESYILKEDICNFRHFEFLSYIKILIKSDIVHIHSSIQLFRFVHVLLSKLMNKKIIITLHSYKNKSKLNIIIDKFLLMISDKRVFVNESIMKSLGYKVSSDTFVKEAFIPPIMKDEKPLDNTIEKIIQIKNRTNSKLLVSNAWRLENYKGQDLYGLDLCIDLVDNLVNLHKINVVFIFIVGSLEKNKDKFYCMKKKIMDKHITRNFFLLNIDTSFVKLIERADIVIRATNTDGDAVSVREALFLGKPVIASDVVRRPENTILFRTRDLNDLITKTLQCIESTTIKHSHYVKKKKEEDYKVFYDKLYK